MWKSIVTSIRIDEDVLREAKALGLNVSKVAENALKQAIEQLRPLYGKKKLRNCSEDSQNNGEKWTGRDLNSSLCSELSARG